MQDTGCEKQNRTPQKKAKLVQQSPKQDEEIFVSGPFDRPGQNKSWDDSVV